LNKPYEEWQTTSISENVYKYLKKGILQGELPAGHRLIIMEIANQFGISQAPVREALERLKHEGLITGKPNKGSVVSEITPKQIVDVYVLRELLEVFAVKETLKTLNQNDIGYLKQIVRDMEQAVREQDALRIVELDLDFHGYFFKRCNNHVVFYMWNHMKNIIMRFMSRDNRTYNIETLPEAHNLLIETLIRGNHAEIEKTFTDHMKSYKYKGL